MYGNLRGVYKELPKLDDKIKRNIVLNGYWQSEKYFSGISEKLKYELTPKYPIKEENKELYGKK